MKYEVEIKEVNHYTLEVEADSSEEAEEIALEQYVDKQPDDMYVDEVTVENMNHVNPNELTIDDLKRLRSEICLGSIFLNDYKNSFGINKNACCTFFDGFLENCWHLAEDLKKTKGIEIKDVTDVYKYFDNIDTLWEYYSDVEQPFGNEPFSEED